MNRLESHLQTLKKRNEKAAVFFITAGDPSLEESLAIMQQLAANGADCIELGMPFSDPIADGPIIQRSTARALRQNIALDDILKLVSDFKRFSSTPVVLMGYYNPLYRYGLLKAVQDCADAGVDGLIIADLPFEEGEELQEITEKNNVCLIYLLAPEIDPKRTRKVAAASRGFIYCVAQYSTTGVDDKSGGISVETIKALKRMTDMPVLVGFGISSTEKASVMAESADGIIIGSWLLRELESKKNKAEHAGLFARAIKAALVKS